MDLLTLKEFLYVCFIAYCLKSPLADSFWDRFSLPRISTGPTSSVTSSPVSTRVVAPVAAATAAFVAPAVFVASPTVFALVPTPTQCTALAVIPSTADVPVVAVTPVESAIAIFQIARVREDVRLHSATGLDILAFSAEEDFTVENRILKFIFFVIFCLVARCTRSKAPLPISPAPVESKSSECLHAPTVELKYLLTVEEYLAYHSPPTGSAVLPALSTVSDSFIERRIIAALQSAPLVAESSKSVQVAPVAPVVKPVMVSMAVNTDLVEEVVKPVVVEVVKPVMVSMAVNTDLVEEVVKPVVVEVVKPVMVSMAVNTDLVEVVKKPVKNAVMVSASTGTTPAQVEKPFKRRPPMYPVEKCHPCVICLVLRGTPFPQIATKPTRSTGTSTNDLPRDCKTVSAQIPTPPKYSIISTQTEVVSEVKDSSMVVSKMVDSSTSMVEEATTTPVIPTITVTSDIVRMITEGIARLSIADPVEEVENFARITELVEESSEVIAEVAPVEQESSGIASIIPRGSLVAVEDASAVEAEEEEQELSPTASIIPRGSLVAVEEDSHCSSVESVLITDSPPSPVSISTPLPTLPGLVVESAEQEEEESFIYSPTETDSFVYESTSDESFLYTSTGSDTLLSASTASTPASTPNSSPVKPESTWDSSIDAPAAPVFVYPSHEDLPPLPASPTLAPSIDESLEIESLSVVQGPKEVSSFEVMSFDELCSLGPKLAEKRSLEMTAAAVALEANSRIMSLDDLLLKGQELTNKIHTGLALSPAKSSADQLPTRRVPSLPASTPKRPTFPLSARPHPLICTNHSPPSKHSATFSSLPPLEPTLLAHLQVDPLSASPSVELLKTTAKDQKRPLQPTLEPISPASGGRRPRKLVRVSFANSAIGPCARASKPKPAAHL